MGTSHLGRWALLAACGLAAGGSLAEERDVASPGDLAAAIAAMPDGGVLRLAGGDWGALELQGLSFRESGPLVLAAADPANPPRFASATVTACRHLTLQGLVFDYRFTPGDPEHLPTVQVTDSEDVAIRGALFDGDDARGMGPASDGYPTAYGLVIRGSTRVSLESSEVRDFLRGAVASESRGVLLRGNNIHGLRSDGLDFAQVEDVLIEGNWIHDFDLSPESGDHPDMIQFWTSSTNAPSRGVWIRGNLLNSGQGSWTESIFMRNEMVDQGQAGAEMFYRDVAVEGNLIINAHLHGITVGETQGLSILNNTLVHNPHSDGAADDPGLWTPQINVASASRAVRIERNVVAAINGAAGQADWSVDGNLLVQDRGRMAPGFYGTVFAGGDPASPGSFRPRPGGPLDGSGLGASIGLTEAQ